MFKAIISTLVTALVTVAVLPSVAFGQLDGPDYWWVNDAELGSNKIRGICSVNGSETDIWVVGEYNTVYHRTGTIHTPIWVSKGPGGYTSYHFNDVCFVDATHGWIVGEKKQTVGDPASYSGVVLYTTDGGTNWYLPYSMPTFPIPTPFRKVKMVQIGSVYYGYISCGNGYVLITRNGTTWSRTPTDPWSDDANVSNWYNGLWIDPTDPNVNRVWVSGDAFSLLAKTENGGQTWTAYQPTAFDRDDYDFPAPPPQLLYDTKLAAFDVDFSSFTNGSRGSAFCRGLTPSRTAGSVLRLMAALTGLLLIMSMSPPGFTM